MSAVLADNERLLTTSEVAHILGCHPSAVIRWIQRGTVLASGARLRLEASAIPGGWRVQRSALDRFLAALTLDRAGEHVPDATHQVTPAIGSRGPDGRRVDRTGLL